MYCSVTILSKYSLNHFCQDTDLYQCEILLFQVHKRPSIESILTDETVVKKWANMGKKSHDSGGKISPSSSDQRSSSPSAMQEWHDQLMAKQKALDAREKEIEGKFSYLLPVSASASHFRFNPINTEWALPSIVLG